MAGEKLSGQGKRKCLSRCSEHQFTLHPKSSRCWLKTPTNIDFCPLYNDTLACFENIVPVFNQDEQQCLPGFILEVDRNDYQRSMQKYKEDHQRKIQEYTMKKTKLQIPKPGRKHRYCGVCRKPYVDYLDHIKSPDHVNCFSRHDFVNVILKIIDEDYKPRDENKIQNDSSTYPSKIAAPKKRGPKPKLKTEKKPEPAITKRIKPDMFMQMRQTQPTFFQPPPFLFQYAALNQMYTGQLHPQLLCYPPYLVPDQYNIRVEDMSIENTLYQLQTDKLMIVLNLTEIIQKIQKIQIKPSKFSAYNCTLNCVYKLNENIHNNNIGLSVVALCQFSLWHFTYNQYNTSLLKNTNTYQRQYIQLSLGTPEQLRIALFKIDYMASQEYTIKYLDYSQNQFQLIINSQEWKSLQSKHRGLCILTRDQLMRQLQELKEQTGFNATLDVAEVLIWIPLKKEDKIMEQLHNLAFKGFTVTLQYSDFLYLYMQGCDDIIQITDTGENVEVTLHQQVNIVSLQLFPFEMSHLCDDLYKFILDLQTILKNKSLNNQLYLLSQFKQVAKQIDTKYNTKIIKYLNNIKYLECLFYINQNAKKVINDVIELRLKYNALLQQKSPNLKKYELSIYENHFVMKYQGLKFDENDFQQYLATNCSTHYQIQSLQSEQTLEFVVQLKKWNHDVRSQLLKLLNEYMNYEFCVIMNYQNHIADHLGEKYDCQIEIFRSNTQVRGIVETYNEEYKQLIQDNQGEALVIRICYLVHSLKQALIEEIKSYNLDISSVESADDTQNNSTADQLFFVENMESNEGTVVDTIEELPKDAYLIGKVRNVPNKRFKLSEYKITKQILKHC